MNIRKNIKKRTKQILSIMLAFVFMATLLPPQKVNAVGWTPDKWEKDGRSDYYLWNQVIGKNDIPNDGQWHRMLLFFQYDDMDKKGHYLSGDAENVHKIDIGTQIGTPTFYYDQTKYAINDSDIDLNDNHFFTETHRNGFFVKYAGYETAKDVTLVKFRTCDSSGNPGKYIGMNPNYTNGSYPNNMRLVNSESEAHAFRMLTSDSTALPERVKKGEMVLWSEYDDWYIAFTDKSLEVTYVEGTGEVSSFEHRDGLIGVGTFHNIDSFGTYLQMKMYIGEPHSATYITKDLNVTPSDKYTFSGETHISPGVTVTVQKGATLAVTGELHNNGFISNRGTIVFNRDSTLGYYVLDPDYQVNYSDHNITGADFYCYDNGTVIVCEGAKVILPKGLDMFDNSVCQNSGVMIFDDGLYMGDNAEFYNHNIGTIEAGYVVDTNYQDLKKDRPEVKSYQQSTVQGDIGDIPVMNYWTYAPYTKQTVEGANSVQSSYRRKWFEIVGKNARFINDGNVYQNTYVHARKGLEWCEGKPPTIVAPRARGNVYNDVYLAGTYMHVNVTGECQAKLVIPFK